MSIIDSLTSNPRVVALARKIVAWPNRRPSLTFLSQPMMRAMARFAMRRAGTERAGSHAEAFDQWRRAAPALADYRLTGIEGETIHAEIHSPCALRGTGDVGACQRMMEYDREILRTVGGELTVLSSQATPGRTFCTVAIARSTDAQRSLQ